MEFISLTLPKSEIFSQDCLISLVRKQSLKFSRVLIVSTSAH